MDELAPGDLAQVQRFVNTADLETRSDELGDPARLSAWLDGAGLAPAGAQFDEAGRERIVEFREALRALLLANATGDPPPSAALETVAGVGDLRVDTRLQLAGEGLAALLAIVVTAQADGTWARLKACPGRDCQWALYDRTRSRTRRWCAGAKCGARTRSRAYRARRAAGA